MSEEPGNAILEALIDELARVLHDAEEARDLALRAGFPAADLPDFGTAVVFWSRVVRATHDGRTLGGVEALVEQAKASFPGNRFLASYGFSTSATAPASMPPEPRSGPAIDNRGATIGQQIVVQGNATFASMDVGVLHSGQPRRPAPRERDSGATIVAGSERGFEEELERYLAKAKEEHGELHLAGFETSVRVTLRLEDLYVPLDAVVNHRVTGRDLFGSAHEDEAHRKRIAQEEAANKQDVMQGNYRAQIPLASAFAEAKARGKRGVIVLGDPGSGKSTHLKQVLLKVERDGSESIGLPPGVVPVLLPLRNLRDRKRELPGFIEQELRNPLLDMTPDFGKRLCKRGRLLLLLDGLDEVANAEERADVARWIEQIRKAGPDCWFMVTCRYAGYTPDVELDASFLELHLRPIDTVQMQRFVTNWYALVERELNRNPEHAAARAERRAKALLETLAQPEFVATARVYEMTHNPLLLTAICVIHRESGQLPKNLTLLYEKCLTVLLSSWRRTKGLPVVLPAEQSMRVLERVALWMHEKDGRKRASREELREPVRRGLSDLHEVAIDADEFLDAVRDECGLLTGWDEDGFGFTHLGFQEYLAAKQLANRGHKRWEELEPLAERFQESWWREVILLMLAQAEPNVFDDLMRAVVRQRGFAQWHGSEMMAMCLSEAANPSARPFVELVWGDERRGSPVRAMWRRLRGSQDAELEARQIAALELLGRAMPGALDELGEELQKHLASGGRAWWNAWQRRKRLAGALKTKVIAGVELVLVPGGRFQMGSPESDGLGDVKERPQHWVEISSFWLARTPVTNAQYRRYMKANPDVREPRFWGDRSYNRDKQPVVGVSWYNAKTYCDRMGLVLPTEAQWEYACRAGTTTRYYSGEGEEDLKNVGWHGGNSGGRLHAVGELEPNAWGLYDMHGNVREWCEDEWINNYEGATHRPDDGLRVDPAAVTIDAHVVRGGIYKYEAHFARSAARWGDPSMGSWGSVSFRPAMPATNHPKTSPATPSVRDTDRHQRRAHTRAARGSSS